MNPMARHTIALLSVAVALYALYAYAALPIGSVLHPELRAGFAGHSPSVLLVHVFASSVALLAGPLQFLRRLRERRPWLHRMLGRAYLGLGVGLGGASGLLLAVQAQGGPLARAGFVLLALAWLASGAAALQAIRRGDVAAHRRWVLRSFTLALAAVTLRLGLPALVIAGVPLAVAYPAMAWLCWLPQALAVEAWLAGALRRPPVAPRASPAC